jgi:hypothetical protein
MEEFTTYIVKLMKKEKLFASQGGPIILSQASITMISVSNIYQFSVQHSIKSRRIVICFPYFDFNRLVCTFAIWRIVALSGDEP